MDFIRLVVLTTGRKSREFDYVSELQEKRLTKSEMCDKTDRKLLVILQKIYQAFMEFVRKRGDPDIGTKSDNE